MRQKIQRHPRLVAFFIAIVCVIVLLIVTATSGNSLISATVADNILRPIFGEQKTLQIESVYFGVGEKIKQVKYSFVPPPTELFTPDVSSVQENNSDGLNIKPIPIHHSFKPLEGEGVWKTLHQVLFPHDLVMAETFVRPDPARSYATVAIVQMDMKKLGINTEAGTRYPGGVKIPGTGFVPHAVQDANTLLAVFNGGFQEKDGHYGMVVGNTTYVPLRPGLATLVMHKDGSFQLINYNGEAFDSSVVAVRQNGPFLVDQGEVTPFVELGRDTWGRTTTNSMYTWRSGIGVTKEGNILYAVGGSLIPQTLAQALKDAGAVEAMQLDINPFWVRFILYSAQGNGQYSYVPLLQNMTNGGKAYLNGYEKDFFYIYKK